jgi:alpha-amylase
MAPPTSARDIDLTPRAGKTYFQIDREWREEFIYFLLVDRFHDTTERAPVSQLGRSPGIHTANDFYGGTIAGITRNLDYIAGLGCTAIWLSPVFENNAGAYHGYNINNYLAIDPHFGTTQDLVDLVNAAHSYQKDGRASPLRVILDVVINHSGDNWRYPGDFPYSYSNDEQFPFGGWRKPDRPVPTELRNPDYYHRRGTIRSGHYDAYPEAEHGDIATLKDYENDDDQAGSELINILIKAHCYWIREADVDGFRVDAVKHMGALACSRFCSCIREYAQTLGKRGFFLFGEVASPDDDIINRYLGQNTSRQDGDETVFFGLDSVLDFRLAENTGGQPQLREVIEGRDGPQTLFDRLAAQRQRALNRGEIGRYLVTFIDNHDSFWQPTGRFGATATDEQLVAGVGYLICALGTACIYYGTEQGFSGTGGDNDIREAMFDKDTPGRNVLNRDCTVYQEISAIARVMRSTAPLRFGRMYFRQISGDGVHFDFPYGTTYTLAFSRLLYPQEALVAYNVSAAPRSDCVIVDASYHQVGEQMRYLYGATGSVAVAQAPDGALYVQLDLAPHQFVIVQ